MFVPLLLKEKEYPYLCSLHLILQLYEGNIREVYIRKNISGYLANSEFPGTQLV
jgi:hypothetical protein